MKPKKKLNVRLLRRIQRHILEEPRRFFMETFCVQAGNQKEWSDEVVKWYDDVSRTRPPCGTAACIAGWVNLLTGGKNPGASSRAADKLGITRGNKWALFSSDDWPSPFDRKYQAAETPKQRAEIACARIDWLIKTGE